MMDHGPPFAILILLSEALGSIYHHDSCGRKLHPTSCLLIEFNSFIDAVVQRLQPVDIVPHADATVYEKITHTHCQTMKDSLLALNNMLLIIRHR